MALINNTDVVTNGLVFCLDAANIKSYPGSGTTWTDLSRSRNNSTLQNGASFDSGLMGSIVFDGVDNEVIINSTTGFPVGTSAGTMCAWAKRTVDVSSTSWIISYGTATANQSRFLGIFSGSYLFGGFGPDGTYISASGPVVDTWFNIVGVWSGTQGSMYINGNLVAGPTTMSWNTVASTAQLGKQTNNTEFWKGNIAQASMYNRALTASEILRNYSSLKERFGHT